MKRTLSLLMFLILVGTLVSCESGNTGNFKISLKLPIDMEGVCEYLPGGEEEDGIDFTNCINATDQIMLTIYSTSDLSEPYTVVDRKLIEVCLSKYQGGDCVGNNSGGKSEFIRSLKKGNYYRFFVEVTNANEKLKLTGGADGIYYDDDKNHEIDIFLGTVGDLVRVVGDRNDERNDFDSLKSYFESGGSKGSAAVALKNGKVYLSGGYSIDYDEIMNRSMLFNMGKISSYDVKNLPVPLMDHAAALLDDGSESGIVVVAFGSNDSGNSNAILAYDPDSNTYRTLGLKDNLTGAKAISIDGDVYIIGGCNGKTGSKKVYKVSKTTLAVEDFSTLNTGRCFHAIADVSTTDNTGAVIPRILVVGGSSDQDGKIPVLDKFAEIVTVSKSTEVTVSDRLGGDSAELLVGGLISAGASTIKFDDLEKIQKAVVVIGGYFEVGEDLKDLVVNKNIFIFSETGENKWTYDVNSASYPCARPSMAAIGTTEKSAAQYTAVNCGSSEISRESDTDQIIFVVQVKRSFNQDINQNIFGASIKESLLNNIDVDSGSMIIDGPITANSLGQAFAFGSLFVYQISGYSIPF